MDLDWIYIGSTLEEHEEYSKQIAKEHTSQMKIKISPFLKEIHGKMDEVVFRLCHTGEWQIINRPNMSKVRWSRAQDLQRERMAEAAAYASAAMGVPRLHEFYLQMAWEKKRNKRPWDMAVSEYYHQRINRLGYDGFWNAEAWREDVKKRRKKNKRKQRYKDE